MCWDSKPLKFMGDKTVSFDLFTKEQVRWKGYCPLKNIPTTFFFNFNVTILPLWRKGFYLSAMSKCSQNQGLRTLTFSLSAGNKTNGQMTAMWFRDYKIYEEAARWGGKWWRHGREREKQVEDGKRNRNASPWTLGFRNEDVCLHKLSTAKHRGRNSKCVLNTLRQVNGSTVGPPWELNETILRKCLVQSRTPGITQWRSPSSSPSASSPNDTVYESRKPRVSHVLTHQ